jgi:hypothetical protein
MVVLAGDSITVPFAAAWRAFSLAGSNFHSKFDVKLSLPGGAVQPSCSRN